MLWAGLVIIALSLGYGITHIKVGQDYILVSCQPRWRLQVNEPRLKEYHTRGEGEPKGIIYLSCNYQKSLEGAGMAGYKEILIYATFGTWARRAVITLYPHQAFWGVGQDNQSYMLTKLVVWELASLAGETQRTAQASGVKAAQSGARIVEVVPWRGDGK